jgi:voltage-gated sodium channel
MTKIQLLRETLSALIYNKYFEFFIMGIIILSAMLIGIDTFELAPTDLMDERMKIHPWSWSFYVSFIFLTTYTFLNMIIGIILESLTAEHKKEAFTEEKKLLRELVEQNRLLIEKVERLEDLLDEKNSNNFREK